jgi:protease-4
MEDDTVPASEPIPASPDAVTETPHFDASNTVTPPGVPRSAQRPEIRERRGVPPIFWGLLFGCGPWLLLFLFALIGMASLAGRGDREPSGPCVGLIHITGIITAGAGGGSVLTGGKGAGSERIVELLDQAAEDKDVKAIVLRVDSPGGSPVGSQEVYDEINRVRKETHKPIVVSMGDLAASGGYYISSAADRIFANASTMTASIGVISEFPQAAGLLKKLGAGLTVIKSGKFKDVGNPARPMTTEETALMKAMIMDVYGQFVNAVAAGRKLPKADVLKIADGRVMTGDQAKRYKLVDEIGGLREAVDYAGKQGGIEGRAKTREIGGQKGLLSSLVGSDCVNDQIAPNVADGVRALRLMADPRVQEAARELMVSETPKPSLR